jgi:ABC-type nickel/cobalt efflux system permease component RcnA
LSHLPIFGHYQSHEHQPTSSTSTGIPPWKTLIAIGLADGLTPSPSALVVLIAAISLHRISLGIALIVVFSVGHATVLAAISLGLLFFRQTMDGVSRRVSSTRVPFISRIAPSLTSEGIIVRALPMAGAIALVTVGLLLTLRALGQPVGVSI